MLPIGILASGDIGRRTLLVAFGAAKNPTRLKPSGAISELVPN